ncbi:MAG TPA: T9SS type A sorting domain-containing protein, partial [Bacteroidetes bacterium]|nr:T9SS type A sorting domain-containing protein [Bacteroidota bacterium]
FYTDWVYITHSGYKDNEFIPRIHRSKNRGEDWEDISSDLPNIAINDVYILPGHADSILFVATDAGVYASMDAGGSWGRLGTNMPYVPSFDLDRNPAHNTLIAGTFARSIMTYPIDSLLPDTPVATNGVVAPNSRLEVYPNPASHTLHIVWNGQPPNKTIDMAVMGTKGKAWRYNQSGTQWDVDVSALPAGIYFIKAQSGSVVQHGRFLKK